MSRGHISWPAMTCWPQMKTYVCAPLTDDQSMSLSSLKPLPFLSSWVAA